MSDLTHSAAAEEILRNLPVDAHPLDVAQVHASLAVAKATRELDTTVRVILTKAVQTRPFKEAPLLNVISWPEHNTVTLDARRIESVRNYPLPKKERSNGDIFNSPTSLVEIRTFGGEALIAEGSVSDISNFLLMRVPA